MGSHRKGTHIFGSENVTSNSFPERKSLKKKKKEFQTDKYMKKKPNPNHKNVKYA